MTRVLRDDASVSAGVTALRAAALLLSRYEEIWRGRVARIDEILTGA